MPYRSSSSSPSPNPRSAMTPAGVALLVLIALGNVPPSSLDAVCRSASEPPAISALSVVAAWIAWERRQE